MKKLLAVGFGGMLGTVLRAAVYAAIPGNISLWIVNLTGSFLLGWLSIRLSKSMSQEVRLLLTTGLLGSFTTFSAFSAQWSEVLTATPAYGLIYGIIMTATAIAMAALGVQCGMKGVER
ncbi:fluoride efflux transporter FluC [Planococcus lenghuensis]|uniref:Fluoride-specific ion channel FluC n=1 Tax=Planococcus lenghuensis TaxID=2213202 RepID=A0A1Q2KWB9_9BACL|nr:CrcB family protein [Planococcus lenghuensis]AQQ52097.1 hypothetical protein B0X71_02465 [Planococcus lenghuensis]